MHVVRVCSAAPHSSDGAQSINNHHSVDPSDGNPFLNEESHVDSDPHISSSRKRKRQAPDYEGLSESRDISEYADTLSALPAQSLLDTIVDTYFTKIHPWVPLLHEGRFRARLEDRHERLRYGVVLHALVAITMKHVRFDEHGVGKSDAMRQARRSRNVVVLAGMDTLSVENLQALVLVAFDLVSHVRLCCFAVILI
jgi:hypothetical protein